MFLFPDTRNLTPETYTIYLSAHSLRQPAPLLKSTAFEEAYLLNTYFPLISNESDEVR